MNRKNKNKKFIKIFQEEISSFFAMPAKIRVRSHVDGCGKREAVINIGEELRR